MPQAGQATRSAQEEEGDGNSPPTIPPLATQDPTEPGTRQGALRLNPCRNPEPVAPIVECERGDGRRDFKKSTAVNNRKSKMVQCAARKGPQNIIGENIQTVKNYFTQFVKFYIDYDQGARTTNLKQGMNI